MTIHYEVTAACVTHIPASTSAGPMLLTLYRGNRLPSGVPEKRLKHLLDGNMIRAVDEPGPAREPIESEEEEDEEPVLTVNSRSNKEELIEYGVAQGGNRDELKDKTVRELQALYLKSAEQPPAE